MLNLERQPIELENRYEESPFTAVRCRHPRVRVTSGDRRRHEGEFDQQVSSEHQPRKSANPQRIGRREHDVDRGTARADHHVGQLRPGDRQPVQRGVGRRFCDQGGGPFRGLDCARQRVELQHLADGHRRRVRTHEVHYGGAHESTHPRVSVGTSAHPTSLATVRRPRPHLDEAVRLVPTGTLTTSSRRDPPSISGCWVSFFYPYLIFKSFFTIIKELLQMLIRLPLGEFA